jgi:hypothetical protein
MFCFPFHYLWISQIKFNGLQDFLLFILSLYAHSNTTAEWTVASTSNKRFPLPSIPS